MNDPADIHALAKQALRVLVQRQPVYFGQSESLLDDLCFAYARRDKIPAIYKAILREARTSIMDYRQDPRRLLGHLPTSFR